MFKAYLDESGHQHKDWMYLAGFLGHEKQWQDFVPKWKAALGPQRKTLHVTDLRWGKDCTRRLLDRLGPIPEECGLVPVLGGVRYGDYEDLVSGSPEEKSLRGYTACLVPLVLHALKWTPLSRPFFARNKLRFGGVWV